MNKTKQLIEYLKEFVTPHKLQLFEKNLQFRSRYITVGLEDIYQPHNASAVLRTCDCFGVQDVNIIENDNKYNVNPDVALGSDKWLNLHKYNKKENNTIHAINTLKEKGYRIIATTLHQKSVFLEDFDLYKGKCAIFFGQELRGLTDTMIKNADEHLKIPMYGFTESFNISVSAAITLHHLTNKLRASDINWQLSEVENDEILLNWLKNTIKKPDLLIEAFNRKQ